MEWELTVVHPDGRGEPTIVTGGPDATVTDLRTALGAAPGPLYLGTEPLAPDRPLRDIDLATGRAVGIGRPVPTPGPAGRTVTIVGGRGAGIAVPLPDAGATVGRAVDRDLTLDDPEVSRAHARIWVDEATVRVADTGSRNGTIRHGYRIAGTTDLVDDDVVQVGETVLAVRAPAPPGATLAGEGPERLYNRPPRISAPRLVPELSVPAEPQRPRGFRFPLGSVLVPLLMAGVMYAVMPNAGYYLIFLGLSPLMAIASLVSDRRSGRKEFRTETRRYQAESAVARVQLTGLAREDERASRRALPDPATVRAIATGPGGRLFERRPGDADFLHLRVGLHDRPTRCRLTGPGAGDTEVPTAYSVPVAVDLAAAGVLGVSGPRAMRLAAARALLAQAATLHAPHDLGVVVLTGRDTATDWEWTGWLPHTRPHAADVSARRLIATDAEQAEARLAELRRLVEDRRTEQRAALRDGAPLGRRMLLVIDGARRLRGLAGLAELLVDGPAVGVYALCLDADAADLPDECRATVVSTTASGTRARLSTPGREPDEDVLVDGLAPAAAQDLAAALAPVRVLGARWGADGDLPDTVRFLELAELPTDPDQLDLSGRWGACDTRILLGSGPDGPIEVDLRTDGPHALVAGTSGAGKSELLQTLVASLATNNPPDACTFVLVDYKGGSAFAECRDLPHCVGMVTDLDGHLVRRALASLSAELKRREAILAGAGAKDIEDYWARTNGRLPRLVIVVDEFASLVEEVPEFVTGVVGIGMRGRSLGVHVVLATQRPAGVVKADLRANLNLRICLRVTSSEESADVVDVPDAARLSRRHPGRAYLRTGHSDLALVQAARVGWPRTEGVAEVVRPTARPRRFTELGRSRTGTQPTVDGHAGGTDLTVLVAAARDAAQRLAIPVPASPWLPPLPDQLTLAQLEPVASASPLAVPLGLADQPDKQAQSTYTLDLATSGPVVVAGMARSGRSTLLRTLGAALAARTSPADAHLYILDQGNAALAPLRGLPHCGAYVPGEDTDRTGRLLALLSSEVERRSRLLAAGGHGSLAEQRSAVAAADRLPYLVLLVDRYETFLSRYTEVDAGRLVDTVDGLIRRGPAVGLSIVLGTDRSGFGHRVASAVATRLVLRQAEREDCAVYGLNTREVPTSMPPGRVIVAPDGTEFQTALLAPDPDGAAQAAEVEALAVAAIHRWDGLDPAYLPHRIDPLPASISRSELAELRAGHPAADHGDEPTRCTIGAGGDHLAPVDIDLAAAGSTFVVAGPPGTGRSTALYSVLDSLAGRADGRLPVIAICPRQSPLRTLAGQPGVLGVLTAGPELAGELEELVCSAPGPIAIAVDDAELLAEGPVATLLEQAVRAARDDGSVVIAAGTTEDLLMHRYRGWLAMARRSRSGLLLNPTTSVDGEVFDLRLPRSTCGGWPVGRGLLVRRGSTETVQVAAGSDVTANG